MKIQKVQTVEGRKDKSLLCEPGPELRVSMGRNEKKNEDINGMTYNKKYCQGGGENKTRGEGIPVFQGYGLKGYYRVSRFRVQVYEVQAAGIERKFREVSGTGIEGLRNSLKFRILWNGRVQNSPKFQAGLRILLPDHR